MFLCLYILWVITSAWEFNQLTIPMFEILPSYNLRLAVCLFFHLSFFLLLQCVCTNNRKCYSCCFTGRCDFSSPRSSSEASTCTATSCTDCCLMYQKLLVSEQTNLYCSNVSLALCGYRVYFPSTSRFNLSLTFRTEPFTFPFVQ